MRDSGEEREASPAGFECERPYTEDMPKESSRSPPLDPLEVLGKLKVAMRHMEEEWERHGGEREEKVNHMLKVAVAMDAQELSETHDDRDFDDTWGDLHADGVGGWQSAQGTAGVAVKRRGYIRDVSTHSQSQRKVTVSDPHCDDSQ